MDLKVKYEDFLEKVKQLELDLSATEVSENEYNIAFSKLTSNSMYGFGLFKAVYGEGHLATDFIPVFINPAFEKMSLLTNSTICNQLISEAYPEIKSLKLDWTTFLGHIAKFGAKALFQYYSVIKDKWFIVSAYSPEQFYFVVAIDDITVEKNYEINKK